MKKTDMVGSSNSSSFIAEFAQEKNGYLQIIIKIEKGNGEYVVQTFTENQTGVPYVINLFDLKEMHRKLAEFIVDTEEK
jgi:hypothetical protein